MRKQSGFVYDRFLSLMILDQRLAYDDHLRYHSVVVVFVVVVVSL